MAPPLTFGTEWRPVGTHRRYGHDLPLWLCDEPSAAYKDAYRILRGSLVGAGYSWTDRGHGHAHLVACWWDMGVSIDAPALQVEVDHVVAEATAARAERALIEAERLAEETARLAPLAAPIRNELAEIVTGRPWMLGRHLTAARDLLSLEDWTIYGLQDAERHLRNARGNAERAAERLGRRPPAVWYAKAEDEGIRAAALQACRYLSSIDEDWASSRNAIGWSQATTWTGHLLSEKPVLDQGEAAHAMALLHGHRRQVPDDLAMRLFGEVFSRRRRPDPAAPTLAI